MQLHRLDMHDPCDEHDSHACLQDVLICLCTGTFHIEMVRSYEFYHHASSDHLFTSIRESLPALLTNVIFNLFMHFFDMFPQPCILWAFEGALIALKECYFFSSHFTMFGYHMLVKITLSWCTEWAIFKTDILRLLVNSIYMGIQRSCLIECNTASFADFISNLFMNTFHM